MATTTEEEARCVKLFIGSLFDFESSRHQYLYLHGDGGDGKSTLIAAMFAMFNTRGCRTMRGDSLDGPHSSAALEGVRLLAFPDCNRPSLPSTGAFKEITGDDTTSINPKGLPMREITLHCKVVISSNDDPTLTGQDADIRRILPVKFIRKEGTVASQAWKREFIASAPQIAQHCIDVYREWRKQVPDADIPQASGAMELVKASTVQTAAEDLVNKLFEFDKDYIELACTVADTVRGHTRDDERLYKQVMRAVRAAKAVSDSKKLNGVSRRIWKGMKVRGSHMVKMEDDTKT
jgi:ABC-type cobalamin/Fe3+-siderophores transport system ATPase subunit